MTKKLKRGFAAMDPKKQRAIASMGGKTQGQKVNPGNFANDRKRAQEAGRKGGQSYHPASVAKPCCGSRGVKHMAKCLGGKSSKA